MAEIGGCRSMVMGGRLSAGAYETWTVRASRIVLRRPRSTLMAGSIMLPSGVMSPPVKLSDALVLRGPPRTRGDAREQGRHDVPAERIWKRHPRS